jgi:hypothetical protein
MNVLRITVLVALGVVSALVLAIVVQEYRYSLAQLRVARRWLGIRTDLGEAFVTRSAPQRWAA